MTRLVINSVSCTSAFSQYAAKAALDGPWEPVEEMVAEFRARRDLIVEGLNKIPGISCQVPHGAFYVFPRITDLGLASARAAGQRLLPRRGVAVLPGTAFGSYGEGYLRLSYANSTETCARPLGGHRGLVATSERVPNPLAGEGAVRGDQQRQGGNDA